MHSYIIDANGQPVKGKVLILVLMEDALVRINIQPVKRTRTSVLILVLMEDALVLAVKSY